MCCKGLFKRIVPFFLTFAAGLFIASFFVTIATPNFNFRRGSNKYREVHRLRIENQEQQRTIFELRKQNDQLRRNASESVIINADEFPLEADVQLLPPPTKAPRHPRSER
jgi:hypothetical protein